VVRYGASAVFHAQQAPEVPLSPWRVFTVLLMLIENTCMIEDFIQVESYFECASCARLAPRAESPNR